MEILTDKFKFELSTLSVNVKILSWAHSQVFVNCGKGTNLYYCSRILVLHCDFEESFPNQGCFDIFIKNVSEEKRKISDSVQWQKPLYLQKIQKAMRQHKNVTKNFDYSTIANRLRTVSWGNDSHPTGVVKPVNGIPTFPLTANVLSKGHNEDSNNGSFSQVSVPVWIPLSQPKVTENVITDYVMHYIFGCDITLPLHAYSLHALLYEQALRSLNTWDEG